VAAASSSSSSSSDSSSSARLPFALRGDLADSEALAFALPPFFADFFSSASSASSSSSSSSSSSPSPSASSSSMLPHSSFSGHSTGFVALRFTRFEERICRLEGCDLSAKGDALLGVRLSLQSGLSSASLASISASEPS